MEFLGEVLKNIAVFAAGFVTGLVALGVVAFFVYRNNKCKFVAIEEIIKKGQLSVKDCQEIYNIIKGKTACG